MFHTVSRPNGGRRAFMFFLHTSYRRTSVPYAFCYWYRCIVNIDLVIHSYIFHFQLDSCVSYHSPSSSHVDEGIFPISCSSRTSPLERTLRVATTNLPALFKTHTWPRHFRISTKAALVLLFHVIVSTVAESAVFVGLPV